MPGRRSATARAGRSSPARSPPVRRRRACPRPADQPPRRVPAPPGAQVRRAPHRPPGRKSPHLSSQSRRPPNAPRRARSVLDQRPRRLQRDRRTTRQGKPMTPPRKATSIRHQVTVDAPIEKAFAVFTEDFGSFKPREHNMLAVDIAETVFETARRRAPLRPRRRRQRVPLGARARLRAARPRRDQLGHQPALADRDRPREDQRGRGALHRRGRRPHARRARAPQPRPAPATAGRASARASTPAMGGRSTCAGTQSFWRPLEATR